MQSSITARDPGIVKLNTVAGEPPSAITMLERLAAIASHHELGEALRDGRIWCAAVRQTHVAHPTLIYFQSIGSEGGWPAALGALLDLSLVVEHLIDDDQLRGRAALLRNEGTNMARQLASSAGVEKKAAEPEESALVQAYERLAQSGYPMRSEPDFRAAANKRAEYKEFVDALAEHLGKPASALVRQS